MSRHTITTYNDLDRYKALWVKAEQNHIATRHPFLDFDCFKIYAKHFLRNGQLKISIYEEKNKVVIFPMFYKQRVLGKIAFIGEKMFDYGDIIANSTEFFQATDFLEQGGICAAEFAKVREDSPLLSLVKALSSKNQKKWGVFITDSVKSPYLSLESKDWEGYFGSLKKNFRTDINRQIKRISSLGNLSFNYCKDAGEAKEIFDQMHKQHIKRREHLGQSRSIFLNEKVKLFYNELNQKLFSESKILLFYLKLNENIIAVAQCFLYDLCIYYYIPTFDVKYAQYSPGKILLYYIIKFSFENRVKEVDFMIGDEDYKLKWKAQTRQTKDIYFFKKNILGAMF